MNLIKLMIIRHALHNNYCIDQPRGRDDKNCKTLSGPT